MRLAVDEQRAADRGRIAAVAAHPHAVAHDHQLRVRRDFVLGEHAADAGVAAEDAEEAGGDAAGRDRFGLAVAGDRALRRPDALEALEERDPCAEPLELEGRQRIRRG